MKTAIIVSAKDPAGMNIKERLLEGAFGFEKKDEVFQADNVYSLGDVTLYTVDKDSIFCENIDKEIGCDRIVFATEHQSAKGKPSLCVHAPGNWGRADMGGKEGQLCPADPQLMRSYFLELCKNACGLDFELTYECTHHGPATSVPTMFVEIGSSMEQWTDKKAAVVVARTLMSVLSGSAAKARIAIGVGGPHYCNNFNKMVLRDDIAIGHVCPKHFLSCLDERMVRQAMAKSGATVAILDWKGLGSEKARLKELLAGIGIETIRV